MKYLPLVLTLLLCATATHAQTVTKALEWDHVATSLSTVNSYTFSLKVDAAGPVPAVATCAAVAADTHCSTPLPALSVGTHVLILTAINTSGATSSAPVTYAPGVSPTQPLNLTITIKIIVP